MHIRSDAKLARNLMKPADPSNSSQSLTAVDSRMVGENPEIQSEHRDNGDLVLSESHTLAHLSIFPVGPGWKEHAVKPNDTLQVGF